MPAYGSGPTPLLSPGYPIVLWDDEAVPRTKDTQDSSAAISQALCMHRSSNLPNCLSVQLEFDADPGAFAVELQVADTDEEKYYVAKATMSTGLNSHYIGRMEVMNIVAKFVHLKMVDLTNPVKVMAKIF